MESDEVISKHVMYLMKSDIFSNCDVTITRHECIYRSQTRQLTLFTLLLIKTEAQKQEIRVQAECHSKAGFLSSFFVAF